MPEPLQPEATQAAEAVIEYLSSQNLIAPGDVVAYEYLASARIIQDKMAPAIERAFKEGCKEDKCTASSRYAEHAWLHSKARAALSPAGQEGEGDTPCV